MIIKFIDHINTKIHGYECSQYEVKKMEGVTHEGCYDIMRVRLCDEEGRTPDQYGAACADGENTVTVFRLFTDKWNDVIVFGKDVDIYVMNQDGKTIDKLN
jgi:tryptophan synthase beta subunit